MTQLKNLRGRLARLKRRRRRVRLMTGASAVAIALLAGLAVVFPIDWYFQQTIDLGQRLILLGVCLAGVLWALVRYAVPWLGRRETELDMALLVERHERIDSDLVAALQFESPQAGGWGSRQMQTAVIEEAARQTPRLDLRKALPREVLWRRLRRLTVLVLLWAGLAAAIPQHVVVFLHRLLLANEHYPSRTQIDNLSINEVALDPADTAGTAISLRYGQPVRFRVSCSATVPSEGRVVLTSPQSGLSTQVKLEPLSGTEGVLAGELPRLVEEVRYRVFAGDAWTDPGNLQPMPLPTLDLRIEVVPPAYAAKGSPKQEIPAGVRQFSVLEGSQVRMTLRADKPLREALLKLDDQPVELLRHAADDGSAGGDSWTLPAAPTALAAVVQPIRYSIQVTDADGQQLERPLEGMIRLEADLEPRIAAASNTTNVLPAAKPSIHFHAIDDHAIARVWLTYEIVRGDRKAGDDLPATGRRELFQFSGPPPASVEDTCVLDLGPLKLQKNDTVKVTLHALDYRGNREGKPAAADPVVFQVTDEPGIWSSMLEEDRESARELKVMIDRQLGIGDNP